MGQEHRVTTEKYVAAGAKTGVLLIRFLRRFRFRSLPMKTINRVVVGLLSSLLLTAGLSRAAERLDPLSNKLSDQSISVNSQERAGIPCAMPCIIVNRDVTQVR